MAKSPSKQSPEALVERALELARSSHKLADPVLIDVRQDVLRENDQPIYQYRVVARDAANGRQYAVALDQRGAELDLAEANRRDNASYFELTAAEAPETAAPAAGSITINPTENILTLNPGDTHDELITVTVPANAVVPRADVYFLADTTGSMESIIGAVQSGANSILASLAGLGLDFAFGVGNYKDFPTDPYAFQHQLNPTGVAADVTTALNSWAANGGVDWPEAQLFALESLAEPPGGPIGWRDGAKRIIVWFGDAPGHDPICAAISGLAADITEATATARLVAEQIAVLAISTGTPGLDQDPQATSTEYGVCGAPGGTAGQGSRIAAATGGTFVSGIAPDTIVNTIVDLVKLAVTTITNINLVPDGASAPFVTSISPATGYGPLATDREHRLEFKVRFTGVAPCKDEDQRFTGSIDVVADGAKVAQKRVLITVPACAPEEVYSYSVKFVCGSQAECGCECAPVRPGSYATEINIHNYHNAEVEIALAYVPLVFAGAAAGRAPGVARPRAADTIVLPPHAATMIDCCRIGEALLGAASSGPLPLTIGFLTLTSPADLSITAVYTAGDAANTGVSIDVEQIAGRRMAKEKTR